MDLSDAPCDVLNVARVDERIIANALIDTSGRLIGNKVIAGWSIQASFPHSVLTQQVGSIKLNHTDISEWYKSLNLFHLVYPEPL